MKSVISLTYQQLSDFQIFSIQFQQHFICLIAYSCCTLRSKLFALLFCVKQLVVAACFFSDEHLTNPTSRNLICGHPGTMLRANHGQVAFCGFCSVFSCFQFPLETPDSAKVLLRNALLQNMYISLENIRKHLKMYCKS